MIITDEILDTSKLDPSQDQIQLQPGKLYLWESTQSGPLNDGVYDVNGNSFAGVQACQISIAPSCVLVIVFCLRLTVTQSGTSNICIAPRVLYTLVLLCCIQVRDLEEVIQACEKDITYKIGVLHVLDASHPFTTVRWVCSRVDRSSLLIFF
jgi:hypothetical protein